MALTTQNTQQLTRKKVMAKNSTHYLPNGKVYTGPMHKTGAVLMTGKTHTAQSKKLSHTPPKTKGDKK
jgi:hypothetical protein